jgi:hypothetical protein
VPACKSIHVTWIYNTSLLDKYLQSQLLCLLTHSLIYIFVIHTQQDATQRNKRHVTWSWYMVVETWCAINFMKPISHYMYQLL